MRFSFCSISWKGRKGGCSTQKSNHSATIRFVFGAEQGRELNPTTHNMPTVQTTHRFFSILLAASRSA